MTNYKPEQAAELDDGTSGQDRKSYTDDQDRDSYTVTRDVDQGDICNGCGGGQESLNDDGMCGSCVELDSYVDKHGPLTNGYQESTVSAEPAPSFTGGQIGAALNKACDEIIEAADLPDTGTRDALNLLVNYTGLLLRKPDATLSDAADDYSIDEEDLEGRTALEVILEWIDS